MVKLTQVDDETATTFEKTVEEQQAKNEVYSEESESESESDFEDDDIENETLYDRVVALRDIIPPQQRIQIASVAETTKQFLVTGINKSGSLLWTLTSSALLLGVPLSLAILAETQLQEMEKEMQLQQSAQDVLAPGSEGAFQKEQPTA